MNLSMSTMVMMEIISIANNDKRLLKRLKIQERSRDHNKK